MRNFDLIQFLMNPKKWWLPLLLIFLVSLAGVGMIGVHTYTEAPPIPDFITDNGRVILSKEGVLQGQEVFQKYALMEYGSLFGDGANRGPDFTADALHQRAFTGAVLADERVEGARWNTQRNVLVRHE